MRTRFFLPPVTDKKSVQEALRYHHEACTGEHQQRSYEWTRTHWFLQGVRKLALRNFNDIQSPTPHTIDPGGQRRIRIEKTLSILQTEMGRLLGIDIGPAVTRPAGVTLDGLRSTAISSAALDSFWTRMNSSPFRISLAYMLAAYGTAGIGAFEVPDAGGIYGASLMLIPPWELRPLPGGVTHVDQVAGVEWSRWVPLDWLRKNFKEQLSFASDEQDMRVVEAPAGFALQEDFSPGSVTQLNGLGPVYNRYSENKSTYVSGPDLANIKYVEMREGWVHGDDFSCLRWNIMLGDHLALDIDYTKESSRNSINYKGNSLPIVPVNVARYLTVGSFWGRGLVDREINLNRELELAVGDLLQEARDSARCRIFMLPTSTGINLRQLQNNYARLNVMSWSPDYSAPSLRPELLQPVPQTGQQIGQAVAMINSFMDGIVHQGPMYQGQAPNRMDSGTGVSQIREMQEVPMMPVGESIAGAMTGAWKSVLGILKRRLRTDDDLTITRIDESLIGVTFDRKTGKVSLSDNPIPDPQQVAITIRSKLPTSKAVIEERLDKLLDKGLISPVQYRISAFKYGLDLPFLNRAEYENYATAWMELITIINDGQKPGSTFTNAEADNHPIHMIPLMEIMGSPVYRLFSPVVRNAINAHKMYHLEQMGAFPEPLANIDQFANVSPPSPDQMQGAMMSMPPEPGQSTLPDIAGIPM